MDREPRVDDEVVVRPEDRGRGTNVLVTKSINMSEIVTNTTALRSAVKYFHVPSYYGTIIPSSVPRINFPRASALPSSLPRTDVNTNRSFIAATRVRQ